MDSSNEIDIPILDVADNLVMLPMIGVIDYVKSQLLMQNILQVIAEKEIEVVVIDISGITTIDSSGAGILLKISAATKLMGCETIISGISPTISQIIVGLDIDLTKILIASTLKKGLIEAYNILGLELIKV